MKFLALAIAALFCGCAHMVNKATGPHGYEYKTSITAIGGGSIERAIQSMGGTLKVYGEDGKPLVDVEIDSSQDAEGMTSDAQAILAGLKLLGSLAVP